MKKSSISLQHIILILLLVAPLCYLISFQNVNKQFGVGNGAAMARISPSVHNSNQHGYSGAKCANFEKDLDELLASSSTVFIAMPAKAGGSSMQKFAQRCTKSRTNKVDRRINTTSVEHSMSFLVDNGFYDIPGKVLAFHLYRDEPFEVLLDNIPRDALVVYVYREETGRLLSAIKQVLYMTCLKNKHPESITPIVNGNQCQFDEKAIVENVIRKRIFEVGWGIPEIMTCGFYEAIERNFPRMVFIHYKQLDSLQEIVGKHKCPDVEVPVQKNMGYEKHIEMSIKLDTSGELVSLNDWIEERRDMLEWTLQLKGGNKCQAKTRTMEDELLACENELLQVTRHTSF